MCNLTNGIRQPPRPPPAHHPAQPPPPARPGHPPALHQGGARSQGSPGGARASTQQPPGSQRPAEATRNQGRASRQRTQGKASTQQRRRGCKASRKRQPYPAQGTGNACAHAEPAPSQTPEPAPPPAPREPTIWRGREGGRGEERGSAQKITALQRRPAPAPDEATAQALHPCRQPSQHPRPDGQPWRAPSTRGFNSAFVEYAELPLTNAAHAIPGEARQGGWFIFFTGKM